MTTEARASPVFTGLQRTAVVAVGILAGSVPSLQPLLLGAMQQDGSISTGQIGQIATVEALGMAVSATLAAATFAPRHLKRLALMCVAVIAIGNLVTPLLEVGGIFAARCATGFASGLVLWILIGLMTRTENPARIFAIYVTCHGASAVLLSAVMANLVLPEFGAQGGYWMLAALVTAFGGLATAIPGSYAEEAGTPRFALPSAPGLVALLAVLCFLAGIFAFWVYLPSIAATLGYDFDSASRAISVALSGQIFGGLLAITMASRLSGITAFVGSAIGCIAVIVAIMWFAELWVFYVAASGFALLWMFAPPFQLPLLMQADPSNRAAMFISPAQLLGVTAGPGLAAMTVEANPQAPAITAAALFFGAIVLALLARSMAGRLVAAARVG